MVSIFFKNSSYTCLKGVNVSQIILPNRTIQDRDSISKCVDKSITSIVIPNTVKKIAPYCFYNCTNLVSVTVPNSVFQINGYAFYGCSALSDLALPDSITWCNQRAFFGCSLLTSISITFSTIPEYAFGNCTSLNSVTLSNNVAEIYGDAFYNCSSLTNITIPESCVYISSRIFEGCTSLLSVTVLSATPPTVGSNMFINGSSSAVIYVPAESVDTYKAASGWSSYASRIQAIPTWSLAI